MSTHQKNRKAVKKLARYFSCSSSVKGEMGMLVIPLNGLLGKQASELRSFSVLRFGFWFGKYIDQLSARRQAGINAVHYFFEKGIIQAAQ